MVSGFVWVWVAIGSALGGMARFGCSDLVARLTDHQLPWGTLLVNILGSLVIGYVAAFAGTAHPLGDPTIAVFLMVGICGGYTTFSAVSLQTLTLVQQGAWRQAAGYVVVSVLLCLVATALGFAVAA
jgi:CrcB protein